MIFKENSATVKFWADRVLSDKCTISEVPALFNLKEEVEKVVNKA